MAMTVHDPCRVSGKMSRRRLPFPGAVPAPASWSDAVMSLSIVVPTNPW
jgi:hypothetical protein